MYKRGHPCRCSHCEGRRTLRKRPDEYRRVPRCTSCRYYRRLKVPQKWRKDNYRAKTERASNRNCVCDGYHHIHRAGSLFCFKNPRPVPDADMARRYGDPVDDCPF